MKISPRYAVLVLYGVLLSACGMGAGVDEPNHFPYRLENVRSYNGTSTKVNKAVPSRHTIN